MSSPSGENPLDILRVHIGKAGGQEFDEASRDLPALLGAPIGQVMATAASIILARKRAIEFSHPSATSGTGKPPPFFPSLERRGLKRDIFLDLSAGGLVFEEKG